MKLHVFPPSPNAIKVLATAHHLGLPFDLVIVDLLKGAQKSAAFTAINPNQKMPILEDDGTVLWESNAITQYLASKKPESGLWPTEPRRQADVSRWQFWQTAHWGPTCGVYVFERVVKRVANLGPANEAEVAKTEPDFHKYVKTTFWACTALTASSGTRNSPAFSTYTTRPSGDTSRIAPNSSPPSDTNVWYPTSILSSMIRPPRLRAA